MTPQPSTPPTYAAYVYPAWHHDEHRPAVDEWVILRNARSCFPGHRPVPRPLHGEYDDTSPVVARTQVGTARDSGIAVLDYFSYYVEDGFVMNGPLDVAIEAIHRDGGPVFAMTWCVRLPHNELPVGPVPALCAPGVPVVTTGVALDELDGRILDEIAVEDLERFLLTMTGDERGGRP